ncbi:hypothetical protein TIFTF001_004655 [Ficus carica]|uniref:Queuosine 5'-phosphate N-glycosylase/hydrolase n=1 Tax=Ficus carica TaxID=3494 RepID=A0AA87ZH16_FICCA|nr:hypothetical protein TIFTF001_004655 [Ficus carica]
MSSDNDHYDFRQNSQEPSKWLLAKPTKRESAVTELVEDMAANGDGSKIFDDGLEVLLAAAMGAFFMRTTGSSFTGFGLGTLTREGWSVGAMEDVRASSAWVASRSSHVIVDSLDADLSYDHLASGLKEALQKDKSAFNADRLQKYTGPQLRELLKWPRPLPLEDERVRLLHEVGLELERSFNGKASNLVESCGKSAAKLVTLVARHFPGFRDHSLYKGHQIFLYKRAQIFAADLWGAFEGRGYGEFNDIGSITIMADYIVPAVLQQIGVLKYSPTLTNKIEANVEIIPGSEEEVELRACSIYAVEKMRELVGIKSGKQVAYSDMNLLFWYGIVIVHRNFVAYTMHDLCPCLEKVLSVELDLWLWSFGIQFPSLKHHRTLSIYY